MSRNWSREELAAALRANPGLRVATEPLSRVANRQPPKVAAKPDLRRASEIPPIPAANRGTHFVHELMGSPSYRGQLEPEDQLSYAVATALRQETNAGRLRAVWFGIPIQHPAGGKYGMLAQAKRTCLGAVPGTPDFGFIWDTGGGFIELKTEAAQGSLLMPSGKAGISRARRRSYLSQRQRLFATWAEGHGVKHSVARSVGEVLSILRKWGVLT
jgi:hypothetical protein